MPRNRLPALPGTWADLPPIGANPSQYAKIAWYILKTVGTGIAYKAFDAATQINPAGGSSSEAPADEWRRFRLEAEDTLSQDAADTQVMTFDIVNYTGGVVDNSWTDADHQTCATPIAAFATSIATHMVARLRFVRIAAYRMAFNDYDFVDDNNKYPPFVNSGGVVWSQTLNITGSGAGTVPPQPTSAVTEQTPLRPNWGRAYLPTLSGAQYDPAGRIIDAACDYIGNAFGTLHGSLWTNDMHLVVPMTSADKVPTRALQGITNISVDNVADVIRRRRHHVATYHFQAPPGLGV